MNQSTAILIMMSVLVVLTIAWWIYRLISFKKKRERIEELAREISEMHVQQTGKNSDGTGSQFDMAPQLPEGDLLILLHKNGRKPWKTTFRKSVKEGIPGLIVSTSPPREIRSQFKGEIKIIWLNRSKAVKSEDSVAVVNPTNLSGIIDETDEYFRENHKKGVILMDRFEDVIQANDMSRVLKFLKTMKEKASRERLAVIVPLSYKATPQRVRNQLQESFEAVIL
ncbi:MAG: DUF835 domain-containing protein [Thermoplasmatota archaeon]